MKNQNDIILCIVAAVFAIGLSITFYATKKTPAQLPEPAKVVVTPAALPPGSVVMANALPNAGSGSGGAGGGAPSFGGGRGGFAPAGVGGGRGVPGAPGGLPPAGGGGGGKNGLPRMAGADAGGK